MADGKIRRADLERTRGPIERASAWLVLFGSLLGAVVTFHGGWAALFAQPSIGRIAAGVVLQLVLTWLQWSYYHNLVISWPARGVDALTTALAYGPIVHGDIAGWFVSGGAGTEPVLAGLGPYSWAASSAWLVIYLASLVVAWYPESRLVD
jgi:hypothetical protein